MTERARLEEKLLKMPICEFVRYDEASSDTVYDIKKFADYLLNNCVIVPPCKEGDIIYKIFEGDVVDEVLVESVASVCVDLREQRHRVEYRHRCLHLGVYLLDMLSYLLG